MEVKLLDPRIIKLEYATPGSAACDLRACTLEPGTDRARPMGDKINLYPGAKVKIGAGFAMHLPPELCSFLLPRSGMSTHYGIVLSNVVGLIDQDYQGEVIMSITNKGDDVFVIEPLMRLAQMVIAPFVRPEPVFVEQFSVETERGAGGYGSTGVA